MIELIGNSAHMGGGMLRFTFPEICPEAKLDIHLHRTLRIPDDSKNYPLPPSLGCFPLAHVDDYKDRVPPKWLKRGGVMLPMFQSEAMWISFSPHTIPSRGKPYLFAVKVATGKRSAVTGKKWRVGLKEKDYLVVPPQPWIDGYVVEEGLIKQFVAMPLGQGFSVEEQLDGKAEFGGIQIEVIPMLFDQFDKKHPIREVKTRGGILRGQGIDHWSGAPGSPKLYSQHASFNAAGPSAATTYSCNSFNVADVSEDSNRLGEPIACAATVQPDMGIGAGGRMAQQIFEDEHGIGSWDMTNRSRVFLHIANSLAWEAITQRKPPSAPQSAALYAKMGYPWYDHYREDIDALKGTKKLKGIKSVLELGFQKGIPGALPENEPSPIRKHQIRVIKNPSNVRDGDWG